MTDATVTDPTPAEASSSTARVSITYCTQCRWLMRAAWVAQELLTTFRTRLAEVALVPGTGGVFRVELEPGDGRPVVLLWDRKEQGGFPEIPPLKVAIRDAVAPDVTLGHTDRAAARP